MLAENRSLGAVHAGARFLEEISDCVADSIDDNRYRSELAGGETAPCSATAATMQRLQTSARLASLRQASGNPLVIILLVVRLFAWTGDVPSFVIIVSRSCCSPLSCLTSSRRSRAQTAVDALREKVALRAEVRRDRR